MTLFTHVQGDIFESTANYIVIPVNCVGVMGAGLAKQYKNRYPTGFEQYKDVCDHGKLVLGGIPLFVYTTYYGLTENRAILFPTKNHWRDKSNYHDIEQTLKRLNEEAEGSSHISIAFPPIGAGLGGLDRGKIATLIKQHINAIHEVQLYDFQ